MNIKNIEKMEGGRLTSWITKMARKAKRAGNKYSRKATRVAKRQIIKAGTKLISGSKSVLRGIKSIATSAPGAISGAISSASGAISSASGAISSASGAISKLISSRVATNKPYNFKILNTQSINLYNELFYKKLQDFIENNKIIIALIRIKPEQRTEQQNRLIKNYVIPLSYLLYSYAYIKYQKKMNLKELMLRNKREYDIMNNFMFNYHNPVIKKTNVFFHNKFEGIKNNNVEDFKQIIDGTIANMFIEQLENYNKELLIYDGVTSIFDKIIKYIEYINSELEIIDNKIKTNDKTKTLKNILDLIYGNYSNTRITNRTNILQLVSKINNIKNINDTLFNLNKIAKDISFMYYKEYKIYLYFDAETLTYEQLNIIKNNINSLNNKHNKYLDIKDKNINIIKLLKIKSILINEYNIIIKKSLESINYNKKIVNYKSQIEKYLTEIENNDKNILSDIININKINTTNNFLYNSLSYYIKLEYNYLKKLENKNESISIIKDFKLNESISILNAYKINFEKNNFNKNNSIIYDKYIKNINIEKNRLIDNNQRLEREIKILGNPINIDNNKIIIKLNNDIKYLNSLKDNLTSIKNKIEPSRLSEFRRSFGSYLDKFNSYKRLTESISPANIVYLKEEINNKINEYENDINNKQKEINKQKAKDTIHNSKLEIYKSLLKNTQDYLEQTKSIPPKKNINQSIKRMNVNFFINLKDQLTPIYIYINKNNSNVTENKLFKLLEEKDKLYKLIMEDLRSYKKENSKLSSIDIYNFIKSNLYNYFLKSKKDNFVDICFKLIDDDKDDIYKSESVKTFLNDYKKCNDQLTNKINNLLENIIKGNLKINSGKKINNGNEIDDKKINNFIKIVLNPKFNKIKEIYKNKDGTKDKGSIDKVKLILPYTDILLLYLILLYIIVDILVFYTNK
jgi:hypothetical protein